jgi:hypothetical protein
MFGGGLLRSTAESGELCKSRVARRLAELGFDSSQAPCHPHPRTRLLPSSYSMWFAWILLAQAKTPKRLALNSRNCLLIRRMIHGASVGGSRGEVRAVRDARRARCGQPPRRRARPCRPFPSRHSPFGAGAGGRTRPNVSQLAWMRRTAKI